MFNGARLFWGRGGSAQILKRPVPDHLVVLSFDDAASSHYHIVAPVLKKYHFGATFFVCEFPPDFSDTTRYMTWDHQPSQPDGIRDRQPYEGPYPAQPDGRFEA